MTGNPKERIIKMANGNPGAAIFMVEAYGVTAESLTDMEKTGITGSGLYILWNDVCGKDTGKAIKLIRNCPLDLLRKLSKIQDRNFAPYQSEIDAVLI